MNSKLYVALLALAAAAVCSGKVYDGWFCEGVVDFPILNDTDVADVDSSAEQGYSRFPRWVTQVRGRGKASTRCYVALTDDFRLFAPLRCARLAAVLADPLAVASAGLPDPCVEVRVHGVVRAVGGGWRRVLCVELCESRAQLCLGKLQSRTLFSLTWRQGP